jgi:hypothetical protein
MLPVDTIDPLVIIDPVNNKVSALDTNKIVPGLPDTDIDPDITTD